MLSSRGAIAPAARVVVIWGVLAGASAAVLLVMGGLSGLQTASIIAAAPFLLVMVGLCVSLYRALLDELEGRRRLAAADQPQRTAVQAHAAAE